MNYLSSKFFHDPWNGSYPFSYVILNWGSHLRDGTISLKHFLFSGFLAYGLSFGQVAGIFLEETMISANCRLISIEESNHKNRR